MDKRFNFIHSNARKIWYINGEKFESDKGSNNGKQKAIAYAREHLLDEKDIKKFDSLMEFNRYLYLKSREEKGEISYLKEHFVFPLLKAFKNADGIEHDELLYEADFYYYDKVLKKFIVEDVKGNLEDVFRVKWKVFDLIYLKRNLAIKCVRMRARKDPLDSDSWYYFNEFEKPQKNVKKLREKNKKLESELKKLEAEKKKEMRERTRMKELKSKEKLTSSERKRLEELKKKYESL